MKKIITSLLIVFAPHIYAEDYPPKTIVNFRAYLSPSIPYELYELIANYINRTTYLNVILSFETVHSGPPRNCSNPFLSQKIDIAHICSPSFIWLTNHENAPIELLPIAPIFKDERAHGKPIYFSDIIVASHSPIKSFNEFKGKTWCYNDQESLSGYFCLLQKLAHIKQSTSFFNRLYESGNHLKSIELVVNGDIDGSAIDSNVLVIQLKKNKELQQKIRIIDSWGPFPIQPFIVRKDLPDDIKKTFINALLQMAIDEKDALAEFFIDGFGPISDQDFDDERALLQNCEHLLILPNPSLYS